MKNIGLIVNAVLGLAVAFLLYNHFKGSSKPDATIPTDDTPTEINPNGLQVRFVDTDSVTNNYQLVKDLEAKFESDNKIREEKLMGQQANLERQVKNYESKFATMTTREKAMEEERLGRLQQQMMQDQQELSQNAQIQQAQMLSQVYDSLQTFFVQYGKANKVDLILSNQKGGAFFYVNPALDITGKAIEHLNKNYKAPTAAGTEEKK